MKKEYDFSNSKKRTDKKEQMKTVKIPTSIRLEGSILSWYKTEAKRQGVPYQTLICSVLHRYASEELFDKAAVKKLHKLKVVG